MDNGISYRRLITDNEKLYIRFNEKFGQFNIQFIFEGQGSVSKSELELAVKKTAFSNPIICSRKKGKYWENTGVLPKIIEHEDYLSQEEILNSNLIQQ